VQMAAKLVLEPIFEADFMPCSYGFRPRRSAAMALEQLRHGAKVDLVITDIMMPRLDGLGLTRAIRQDPARRGLPIVMVTSLGQDHERRQGLEAGADAYLVKADFDRGRFLEIVENLLGTPA